MSVTMREIAKLANISQTSVSFVLNGKRNAHISESNRRKILEIAKRCHYSPNISAKSLRENKRYTVGVLMPVPLNSFYFRMIRSIAELMYNRGYAPQFSFWKTDFSNLDDAYAQALRFNVDGIIAWDNPSAEKYRSVPTVMYFGNGACPFDNVIEDCNWVAKKAAEYLIGLGRTRILLIGNPHDPRVLNFHTEMEKCGKPYELQNCILYEFESVQGTPPLKEILKSGRFNAIFALSDSSAMCAMSAARQLGYRIPEDISVIGYNNQQEGAWYNPALTTFDQHVDKLAETLVRFLMNRIEHPEAPLQKFILRPDFIVRSSCVPNI